MERRSRLRSDPEKAKAWRRRSKRLRPKLSTPTPDPPGPAVCYAGSRFLLPGQCLGRLHRHHARLRSAGGGDGDVVWLCAGHHVYVHDHPAEARRVGLYGGL